MGKRPTFSVPEWALKLLIGLFWNKNPPNGLKSMVFELYKDLLIIRIPVKKSLKYLSKYWLG